MTGQSREGSARAQKYRTAIPGGSMAAEQSYRTSETLTPVFPVLGGGGGGLRDRGPMLALCPFFLQSFRFPH